MATTPVVPEVSTARIMRAGDLARRPGLCLESRDSALSEEAPLFRGAFWHRELRDGLHIHASDVFEEADFTASSTQQAGLFCIFFLQGDVAIEMGERRYAFHGDGQLSHSLVVSGARPETFRRLSNGHQRIRHLVVWATPEWLTREALPGIGAHREAEGFLAAHLAERRLPVTPRIAALVERLMSPPTEGSLCERLLGESAAVEILAQSLSGIRQAEQEPTATLSSLEILRLRRAETFVTAAPSDQLTVEAIAREAGVSVSGLQRLFRAAYGESVVGHVRRRRLEAARERLQRGERTIQQAAMEAGYTSAANFSTAFKRQFGFSPGSKHR